MELYIEKEFLDNFYTYFDETKASVSQKIISNILRDYDEVNWYIDCQIDTMEQLENLKSENPFFNARTVNSSPFPITSIKDHFFKNSNCKQTLIFTMNKEDWFNEAKIKGALCFNYNNYQIEIENMVSRCHFKIDLSEKFTGWEINFKEVQNLLPINKIIVNDSYFLDNIEENKSNIYSLIQSISKNKKTLKQFYTDILNNKIPLKKEDVYNLLKEKYQSSEIKIIHNNLVGFKPHDRLLYTNFYLIDCPIGFNFKANTVSNSQIIIETIFDKYTYKRMKNHLYNFEKHLQSLINEKRLTSYYPN
jgi:hypothetical protein